jgi:hypothetical protein
MRGAFKLCLNFNLRRYTEVTVTIFSAPTAQAQVVYRFEAADGTGHSSVVTEVGGAN